MVGFEQKKVGGLKSAERDTMKINDAVARLVRAGDRNSKAWQKINEAIDEFARWLGTILPSGGEETPLPRSYFFCHWSSGEYKLIRIRSGEQCISICGGGPAKSHGTHDVLRFCEDVQSGFLTEVEEYLDRQSEGLESATVSLDLARKKSECP